MKQRYLFIACAAIGLSSLTYADDSGVIIYGRMHGDIESTRAGKTDMPSTGKVQNDTSRIGFKGYEDLGNNLKAVWQVESGVAIDDGSAAPSSRGYWGTRETYVGLSHATLGTFKLGHFLVAADDLHDIAGNNFQYWTGISNDATLWLNGGDIATGGFDARLGNSVSYQTPNINGFSSRIQYSLTTGSGSKEAISGGSSVISANARYDSGPLHLGYAVQQNRDMQVTSSGFYQSGLAQFLAAGYVVGPLYLAGLFEHDNLNNIQSSGKDRSRNYGSLLANYTIGRNIFSLQYGKAGSWSGDAGVGHSGAWLGSAAYNYKLSNSTQVYVLYTRLNNDINGAYVLGGNPTANAVPAMRNQHSVALGMWKNF
ncbi:porin [Crenobacter sp. SG2305]|uniref:porin n=1 Tax=Crenobacter oryzisoli TaxID=3056844 RepID=UPI0025AB3044|nr:porin [Crenobacter sp. SG2305]MDN0081698.1 porin [Crenobacter sp. SG2305]